MTPNRIYQINDFQYTLFTTHAPYRSIDHCLKKLGGEERDVSDLPLRLVPVTDREREHTAPPPPLAVIIICVKRKVPDAPSV